MRFLIDNALSPALATHLIAAGHDAVHLRDYDMQSGTDEEIFDRAQREQRVIVSADTDFGTLQALRRERSPSVILLRRGTPRRAAEQAKLLLENLPAFERDLDQGSIVVIELNRIRTRTLPLLP